MKPIIIVHYPMPDPETGELCACELCVMQVEHNSMRDELLATLCSVEEELTDLERRLPDGPRYVCLDLLRATLAKVGA